MASLSTEHQAREHGAEDQVALYAFMGLSNKVNHKGGNHKDTSHQKFIET